jgi:hypothetical protein
MGKILLKAIYKGAVKSTHFRREAFSILNDENLWYVDPLLSNSAK